MRTLLASAVVLALCGSCVHVQIASPNDPNLVIAPTGDMNVLLPTRVLPQEPSHPVILQPG